MLRKFIVNRIEKWKQWSLRKKISRLLLLFLLLGFWFCLPNPLFDKPCAYVLEDNQGDLLGASVAKDGQWRFPEIEAVPDKFATCIVTFEDKRFYYHPGIDPVAIVRAIYANITQKQVVSGASTLHMQVMRMTREKDRNLFNKLLESIQALRLWVGYSKKEVLQLYASNAPFGGNVVGLEAASWRYYGRDPASLTWAESATLAVLPNAPSLIHPGKNRKDLLRKRNFLLQKLFENGHINDNELQASLAEPLPEKPFPLPKNAPHLLQWYKKQYQIHPENYSGTRFTSSINATLQDRVTQTVVRAQQHLKQNAIQNAAAMVVDVKTGKVLAYAGNVFDPMEKETGAHVDIIRSKRSPGSLLKPLLYAAMISEGEIMPDALIPDIPTQMAGYVPQNFDLNYDGAVRASDVVSRSLNVPSVRMMRQLNYIKFYNILRDLGISTLDKSPQHYGLSLVLGGGEVTMWDMVQLYARSSFVYQKFNAYDEQGRVEVAYDISTNQEKIKPTKQLFPLDVSSLYFMFSAMEDVMRPGEELFWHRFTSSRRIAWKTGTSYGFRDAWAIGVTPEYVVAVWVGNANGEGRPDLIGVRTAAPILFDIYNLLPASTWFKAPERAIALVDICKNSGFKAGENCPSTNMKVPASCLKSGLCPYHTTVFVNEQGLRVNAQCSAVEAMKKENWFVLPPAMEQYYIQKHADYQALPAWAKGCELSEQRQEMEVIYPQSGAKIKIPRELNGQMEKVIFSVAHRNSKATIHWNLDDDFLGSTVDIHKITIQPQPGEHRLTLVDDNGFRLSVPFEILE